MLLNEANEDTAGLRFAMIAVGAMGALLILFWSFSPTYRPPGGALVSHVLERPISPISKYTLPEGQLRTARTQYFLGSVLFVAVPVWTACMLLLLLRLRYVAKIEAWANQIFETDVAKAFVIVPAFGFTFSLMLLPVAAMYRYYYQVYYGQPTISWLTWFASWIRGSILLWCLFPPLLGLLFRKVGAVKLRLAWLYAWLLIAPAGIGCSYVYLSIISPRLNHLVLLEFVDYDLAGKLYDMDTKANFHAPVGLYAVAAASYPDRINAMLAGIGARAKVVIPAPTLSKLTAEQLMFLCAHETGHYVFDHAERMLLFDALLGLPVCFFTFRISRWLLRRYRNVWGIGDLHEWNGMPVLVLALLISIFFLAPLQRAYSRYQELQADQYGIEVLQKSVTDAHQEAGQTLQLLGEDWREYPDPSRWVVDLMWTHPSISDRVQRVLTSKER